MSEVNEKDLGLLTDDEINESVVEEASYEHYVDLLGLGAATKAVSAAKAGSYAGSAASQL